MNSNSDFYFAKGSSHITCQDYCLNFFDENYNEYIIVSDGCSSSLNSDIGARIIPLIARKLTIELESGEMPTVREMVDELLNIRTLLYLDPESLDATFLMASTKGKVIVRGDGVIEIAHLNYYEVIKIEFPSGYPFYLTHSLSEVCDISMKPLITKKTFDLYWTEISSDAHTYMNDAFNYYEIKTDISDVKQIILFSDGVNSFVNEETRDVMDYIEVIKRAILFKTIKGKFVERTAKYAVRYFEKLNYKHYDDFSMAAINLWK